MGWWFYCNTEVLGAPRGGCGMAEVPLREECSLTPEGFQFHGRGEVGWVSAQIPEGTRTRDVCESLRGCSGNRDCGKGCRFKQSQYEDDFGVLGKGWGCGSLSNKQSFSSGKEYSSGKYGYKGYTLWWILCWFWWLRSPPSSTQDPIKAHLMPCEGSWRIT